MKIKKITSKLKPVDGNKYSKRKECVIKIILEDSNISIEQLDKIKLLIQDL